MPALACRDAELLDENATCFPLTKPVKHYGFVTSILRNHTIEEQAIITIVTYSSFAAVCPQVHIHIIVKAVWWCFSMNGDSQGPHAWRALT